MEIGLKFLKNNQERTNKGKHYIQIMWKIFSI